MQKHRGFYGVLDRPDRALAESLCAVAAVLQVRVKRSKPLRVAVAKLALGVAGARGVPVIVNDDLDLALELGAAGVHVGQEDLTLAEVRRVAPQDFWCGVSTHNPEQVSAAVRHGATYIGFGPVFATTTKTHPDPVVGAAGLRQAVVLADACPVVAIGGVTPARATEISNAGAAMACAISAVNEAADPEAVGQAIASAFR